MLDLNITAACFDHDTHSTRKHHHVAAASLSLDLALHRSDRDVPASGLQLQIPTHGPDVDRVAAGGYIDGATNIIHPDLPAATFNFHPSGNALRLDSSATCLDPDQGSVAGNINHELAGEFSRPSAVPLRHDPGGIALYIGVDFESGLAAPISLR